MAHEDASAAAHYQFGISNVLAVILIKTYVGNRPYRNTNDRISSWTFKYIKREPILIREWSQAPL